MSSVLLFKEEWNLPPSYFSNTLLLCHMLATGIKLPGAVTEFNRQVVEAVTLKFKGLNSDEIDAYKTGLGSVGY